MDIRNKIIDDEVIQKMSQMLFVSSEKNRLKILVSLFEGEKCVSDLEEATGASQSLVSHQLQVLRKAKLITFRKDGNRVFYSLDDDHIYKLIQVAYEHAQEKEQHNEEN
ncbi:MAG: metalloregulator ArsR/SmtB family transcription factor [Bacilli bacterium]|jgi:ArsR family transcriptional regulator|nr:metalloregulator ArsR/SmtB family transcription factor [Bacilli bacterium]